jgi:hypothetical protein
VQSIKFEGNAITSFLKFKNFLIFGTISNCIEVYDLEKISILFYFKEKIKTKSVQFELWKEMEVGY